MLHTIPSTCLLGMCTILSGGHTATQLFLLGFWKYLKVCVLFILVDHVLNWLLADRKYDDNTAFRSFKRQLYHSSISAILRTLRDGMLKPVIQLCPDGHFRHVIYDLAAFIADYPEQVLLAGVVQGWCPK